MEKGKIGEEIKIEPKVNTIWEIKEIADDFMNPLEIFREAISNAYDAGAKEIDIQVYINKNNEYDNLTIKISDDGKGMTEEQLRNFWNLGYSEKRNEEGELIGSKGHGTTIYLKSKYIQVKTTSENDAFESICINPSQSLRNNQNYSPKTKRIEKYEKTGTEITLEGYVQDESDYKYFQQNVIKDYIMWFTKHGSFEKEIGKNNYADNIIKLKAFDEPEEIIPFGHVFPAENTDIEKLKEKYYSCASDYYVKRFVKSGCISNYPNYKYDMVIYVEGTGAKKEYNKMISDNKKNQVVGAYKIADRYGLYLCKDYFPIQKINEWISSFGTGSNSYGLLHGFINCQQFDLTANRGSISVKNREVMEALKEEVQEVLQEIQKDIYKSEKGLDILNSYKDEIRTKEVEENEFEKRKKRIKQKEIYKHKNVLLYEPKNESELYYVYSILNTLYPEEFEFESLDYNSSNGIDMIVQPKKQSVRDPEYKYVELKYMLSKNEFNHSFKNISYILCWDIDKNIEDGATFSSKVDGDEWIYRPGNNKIFLDSGDSNVKIEIIKLKDIFDKHINREKEKIEAEL